VPCSRWSLGSTKDALVAAAALSREAGATEKCLRAAFLGLSEGQGGSSFDAEELEGMSISQLRSYAVTRGVDLGACEGRDDLVATLLASSSASASSTAAAAAAGQGHGGSSFSVKADR
jgi:hypothetical protein